MDALDKSDTDTDLQCAGCIYHLVYGLFQQSYRHRSPQETTGAFYGIGSLILFLHNGTIWTLYSTYVIKWVGAIRRKIFIHISSLSLHQIESRSTGEWITRLNSDVYAATALLNQQMHLPHAVCAAINICASSVILIL